MRNIGVYSLKSDFPEDFELEEVTLEELISESEIEVDAEEGESFDEYWLPPEKPLRF